MRLTLFLLATLIAFAACATTSSAPALSDAERCARFGGYWTAWGVCRSVN
jgi:hypothetical protein